MLRPLVELLTRPLIRCLPYRDSAEYWKRRYRLGGDSGQGPRQRKGIERAAFINGFVERHHIRTVIEFGCGDGRQLSLCRHPEYLGFDISPGAVKRCRDLFRDDPSRSFRLADDYAGETADLALSLQVILHLIEDDVFDAYMRRLFASARRFVVIYSTNYDGPGRERFVRHREFTRWIDANAPEFRLRHEPGPKLFRVYERI